MPTLPARYAFLRLLVDSGVRHLFGNPGTTEEQVLDAIQDFPELQYVLCLHECFALRPVQRLMASSWRARSSSGSVGEVMHQIGSRRDGDLTRSHRGSPKPGSV
ncbi:MAG: hypothetical protein HY329_16695 [Chloroflexi bacterium]|nr:hypothetical protein [Chloroflexota bacterium]